MRISVFALALASVVRSELCRLYERDSNFPGGIYDKLATNVYHNESGKFVTEVNLALDVKRGRGECFIRAVREDGSEFEVTFNGQFDQWRLKSMGHRNRRYHFLLRESNVSFADVGRYDLHFADEKNVLFYNLYQNGAGETISYERADENDTIYLPASPVFQACMEFHEKESADEGRFLSCGSPVASELLPTCTLVGLTNASKSNYVAVKILNATLEEDWHEYVVRCVAETFLKHSRHDIDLRFRIRAEGEFSAGFVFGLFSVLSALILAAVAPIFYSRWRDKRRYLHLLRNGGCQMTLSRLKTMPVSLERQITMISVDEDDSEDEVKEKSQSSIVKKDSSKESDDAEVWPSWILKAKLMRFPRSQVDFDASKPLGCGNYGFVYNGSVKYGTARYFDNQRHM